MKTYIFEIKRRVTVTIDPEKLEPLMAEFNEAIADFGTGPEALLKHAEHIGFHRAIEQCDFTDIDFFEGYGLIRDAGITAKVDHDYDWIEQVFDATPRAAS